MQRFQGRSDLDETRLVEQAQEGSVPAFDEIVRKHRAPVTTLVRSITGCEESAMDAVQDVFLTVYKALPSLQSAKNFVPWLHAIARNRAKRYAVDESRTTQFELTELDKLLIKTSRELAALRSTRFDEQAQAAQVIDEFEKLPEQFSEPALMHYRQGLSVATIARRLDVTASTVKWRLSEARRRVRTKLTASETV